MVIGFFGCKETKKKKPIESSLAGFHVDSMQIYYTTDWLTNKVIDTLTTADSTKKQFFLINRPSRNFDELWSSNLSRFNYIICKWKKDSTN